MFFFSLYYCCLQMKPSNYQLIIKRRNRWDHWGDGERQKTRKHEIKNENWWRLNLTIWYGRSTMWKIICDFGSTIPNSLHTFVTVHSSKRFISMVSFSFYLCVNICFGHLYHIIMIKVLIFYCQPSLQSNTIKSVIFRKVTNCSFHRVRKKNWMWRFL